MNYTLIETEDTIRPTTPTTSTTSETMNTQLTEITPLILAGDGYQLTIAPEAEARKLALLAQSKAVTTVTSNDESGDAQYHVRNLAAMRIEVEKSRKAVKEPINRIGKLIDATAANFLAELTDEEARIKRLVGDHANEVARLKREKEAEERKAFEAARAAREAAEAAAAAAESSNKISDVIAAKKAERERQEALAARMEASTEVATTRVADGVRFAWDFEVVDIYLLAKQHPDLVRIEPKRADILTELKAAEECGAAMDPDTWVKEVGIRPFKKPVVSSR